MRRALTSSLLTLTLTLYTLSLTGCAGPEPPQSSRQVENLSAFAKLYGYVRFFHPSDEAAAIDWDQFAIYGVPRVKGVGSRSQLRAALEELFAPVAPTLRIYRTGDRPPPIPELIPEDTAGLELVSWQHLGVGLGGNTPYRSVRLNRENRMASGGYGFGTVTQGIDARPHRGKQVKLRAFVRADVEGQGNQGQLWLRVDRENRSQGFFDNMADRPIRSPEWQAYEISGAVADDAVAIFFGGFLLGVGQVWLDDFEFYLTDGDAWEPVAIENPGFEGAVSGASPVGWSITPGYSFAVTDEKPHGGNASVRISKASEIFEGSLFDAHPAAGEVLEVQLGAGLSARVPLALFSDGARTIGAEPGPRLDALRKRLAEIDLSSLNADDEAVRLADVVIAWNVFQHFYPYFDVVDVDWEAQLAHSLERALEDRSHRDFQLTLKELVASLADGHGGVYHGLERDAGLPLLVDWVEGRMVITQSQVAAIQRGDVVLAVDGVPALRWLDETERYISGSPQWKRWRALVRFGTGAEGTLTNLSLERDGRELQLELRRGRYESLAEPRLTNIALIEEGIYYVNLDRAPMQEIEQHLEALAAADGVIFDLRGYPAGNSDVIRHLLDQPDTTSAWMQVPQIIYPDRARPVGYENYGWHLAPRAPRIVGKVVFLTDARAISYAESFMGYIEGYRLGEIVGQPTAGTNGNVNALNLPGGFRVTWTGMKVVKHDGSQHHLVGVQPTVPVERTLQGIREGRDEYLEVALEIIRESRKTGR